MRFPQGRSSFPKCTAPHKASALTARLPGTPHNKDPNPLVPARNQASHLRAGAAPGPPPGPALPSCPGDSSRAGRRRRRHHHVGLLPSFLRPPPLRPEQVPGEEAGRVPAAAPAAAAPHGRGGEKGRAARKGRDGTGWGGRCSASFSSSSSGSRSADRSALGHGSAARKFTEASQARRSVTKFVEPYWFLWWGRTTPG